MDDDKCVHDVVYWIWEFSGMGKRAGFHHKLVSSRSDSEAFLGLVCLRCKHLRVCANCGYAECIFGRPLRYKPCGNFASNARA
jgi:hypothetical protein